VKAKREQSAGRRLKREGKEREERVNGERRERGRRVDREGHPG
jgi:hypothetical protein